MQGCPIFFSFTSTLPVERKHGSDAMRVCHSNFSTIGKDAMACDPAIMPLCSHHPCIVNPTDIPSHISHLQSSNCSTYPRSPQFHLRSPTSISFPCLPRLCCWSIRCLSALPVPFSRWISTHWAHTCARLGRNARPFQLPICFTQGPRS